MSYAELLQEWRAGILPIPNCAGRKWEGLKATNGGDVPTLPVPPATAPTPETKAESATVLALVRCNQCLHFQPNRNNPTQGLGKCGIGSDGERPPWPNALRHCSRWDPTPTALLEICQTACNGLIVNPKALAEWLTAQDDPQWMTPPNVRWWAELITERGWPKD